MWYKDYLYKAQVEEIVCNFFTWFVYVTVCFPYNMFSLKYIFRTPMIRYKLFVLKVPLNSSQPTNYPDHWFWHKNAILACTSRAPLGWRELQTYSVGHLCWSILQQEIQIFVSQVHFKANICRTKRDKHWKCNACPFLFGVEFSSAFC